MVLVVLREWVGSEKEKKRNGNGKRKEKRKEKRGKKNKHLISNNKRGHVGCGDQLVPISKTK